MNRRGAEKAVVVSALVVLVVYAYRRATETPASSNKGKAVVGSGPPAPLGTFITAWGFTFFVVSIMATMSPQFGGSFAVLIATGDVLANTQSVAKDLNAKTKLVNVNAANAKGAKGAKSL